jgi:DeoR/GlpR family transcriptional regulator of sugar metabolism
MPRIIALRAAEGTDDVFALTRPGAWAFGSVDCFRAFAERALPYITTDVVDEHGIVVPGADNELSFSVRGGRFAGADNGREESAENYKSPDRAAFNGKALAIVQSTDHPGPITVTVTSPGLRPATTVFAGHGGGQSRRAPATHRPQRAASTRQAAQPTADASFSGSPSTVPAAMLDGNTTSGGWSNFYNKAATALLPAISKAHPADWVSVSWPSAQAFSTTRAYFTLDARRVLPKMTSPSPNADGTGFFQIAELRGGAMPSGMLRSEQPFEIAEHDLAGEKAAIGAYAAGLVAAGDTVLLDVGTTTTAIARALVGRAELREVTVVTSGLRVALELERAWPRISVIVTGGTLRPLQHSLVNPLGTVMLERLNAAVAFIGCNGVNVRGGVTNINLPEAEIKRAMMLAARRPIVVADGSKLGEMEVAKVCDLAEVSMVVTDRSADPAIVAELTDAGCSVQMAG